MTPGAIVVPSIFHYQSSSSPTKRRKTWALLNFRKVGVASLLLNRRASSWSSCMTVAPLSAPSASSLSAV